MIIVTLLPENDNSQILISLLVIRTLSCCRLLLSCWNTLWKPTSATVGCHLKRAVSHASLGFRENPWTHSLNENILCHYNGFFGFIRRERLVDVAFAACKPSEDWSIDIYTLISISMVWSGGVQKSALTCYTCYTMHHSCHSLINKLIRDLRRLTFFAGGKKYGIEYFNIQIYQLAVVWILVMHQLFHICWRAAVTAAELTVARHHAKNLLYWRWPKTDPNFLREQQAGYPEWSLAS